MTGDEYWQKRSEDLERLIDGKAQTTAQEISKLYEHSLMHLEGDIRRIFGTFAKNSGLSAAEAEELLTQTQTRETRKKLEELLKACNDPKTQRTLRAMLDAPAYAYRISKLEALRAEAFADIAAIGLAETQYVKTRLADAYRETYYKTAYDLSYEAGVNVPFEKISNRQAAAAIKHLWAPGTDAVARNYSDRVWSNTTKLAEDVREIITQGILTGRTYDEMIESLTFEIGTSQFKKQITPDGKTRTVLEGSGARYRAARLVRTECNHISGQARMASYEDAGIDRYIYRAYLELRTCKRCGELDGNSYPVKEQQVGVNMHPLHPHCFCFTAPYRDKETLNQLKRAAETGEGQYDLVPQGMTYKEWREKYVDGKPDMELAEKKERRKSADTKQAKEYRRVLGKNVPEELADFQRLKYNDPEKWKEAKREYRDQKHKQEEAQREEIRKLIRSTETKKTLNRGNQNKHIPSSSGFIEGRSYIYGTLEDAQALVNQYHGTGEIKFSKKGEWIKKEFVTADSPVGVWSNQTTGEQIETRRFAIHYGKAGTHVVPAKEE